MEKKVYTMSQKEINRLQVIEKVESKQISQLEAAQQLGIRARQVRRLQATYRSKGVTGLLSERRGKPSNNKLSDTIKSKAVELIEKKYADFGPTLAHEKLTENHDMNLSVESCRKIMIKHKIWKPKRKKIATIHAMRTRRSARGELVQIDGSPHAWFEDRGPKCTLLVFVDDATSEIMQLHFEAEESTQGYFDATKKYLFKHGVPVALYSDRHGIFRVNIPEAKTGTGETQYSRAMRELGISLINANSPQAKGRVERLNGILQDRLVKELRLQNISTIAFANQFALEYVVEYNKRFSVEAASSVDAHQPLVLDEIAVDNILCHRYARKITKNLEVHYQNKIYQIQPVGKGYTLRQAHVGVYDCRGIVTLMYKGKPLDYKIFEKAQRGTPIASSKQINTMVDKRCHKPPAENHPCRRTI